MTFEDCPHCAQRMGFKRNIGIGSFIVILITFGWWLWALIFYPIRCVRCGYCPRFSAWQKFGIAIVVAIPILIVTAVFASHTHSPDTPQQTRVPIVDGPRVAPTVIAKPNPVSTEALSSEEWPLGSFSSSIRVALTRPDIALHGPAMTSDPMLSIGSDRFVMKTDDPADGCGNIGCQWHLVNVVTGTNVLSGYSSVHIGPNRHNSAEDLVVEDRGFIREYQYDGTNYAAVNCYHRANYSADSPVEIEDCSQIAN